MRHGGGSHLQGARPGRSHAPRRRLQRRPGGAGRGSVLPQLPQGALGTFGPIFLAKSRQGMGRKHFFPSVHHCVVLVLSVPWAAARTCNSLPPQTLPCFPIFAIKRAPGSTFGKGMLRRPSARLLSTQWPPHQDRKLLNKAEPRAQKCISCKPNPATQQAADSH